MRALWACVVCVLGWGAAQAAPLVATPWFEPVGTAQGLPSVWVNEIATDEAGFLWLATADGLARYDGVGFEVWRHDPADARSLPANGVETVFVDRADRVWVGSEDGGLAMLDRDTGQFVQYRHDPTNPRSLSGTDVWAIAQDRHGSIWAGTYGAGLNRVWPEQNRIEVLRHSDGDATSLAHDTILSLLFDRQGWFWVATAAGLSVYAPPDVALPTAARQFLAGQVITMVREDHAGNVWIGTRTGLHRVPAREGAPVAPEPIAMPIDARAIESVVDDGAGGHWISARSGLWSRTAEGEVQRVPARPGLPFALPSDNLLDAARDREGGVWFAFVGAGLAHLKPQWRNFSLLRDLDAGVVDPGRGWSPALTQCADGAVWSATTDAQLLRFDPSSGQVTRVSPAIPNEPHATVKWVFALACDTKSRLWIGHRFGLWRYDPRDKSVRSWVPNDDDTNALTSGNVDLLLPAADGALWASALGGALHRIDADDRVHRLQAADGGPRSREIEQLRYAADGALWVVGTEGVDVLAPGAPAFAPVPGAPQGRVDSVAFDAQGSVWLHTAEALRGYRMHDGGLSLEHTLDAALGLPSAEFAGIVPARDGALWLSGPRGLWRVAPDLLSVRAYGRADGLYISDFGTRPPQFDGAGRLFLSSAQGVVAFDPSALTDNPVAPTLAVLEASVRRGESREPLLWRQPVTLRHRDRDLRVSVRALSLADAPSNRYRFKLDGVDEDWVETGARGEREFVQLPAGEYRLWAQGSNNSGVWAQQALEVMRVTVSPPPWASWPAYLGYAGLAALAVWLGVRAYRRRLEARHAYALAEERRLAAERENRAKSDFLADIGHEIRTPMSGLLGMTELLQRTELDGRQKGYVQTVRRSGEHLLKLINDLLDLSRIEAGKLTLESAPCELRAVVRDALAVEMPLAGERGLTLSSTIDPDVPEFVEVDSVRLKEVLLNLLNNALKFTNHGRVSLHVARVEGEASTLAFTVSDTGPGMSADQVQRLFERFEQGEQYGAPRRRGGSGLGLSITRRLIDLMGGAIDVRSELGRGTQFRVCLPLRACAAPAPSTEISGESSTPALGRVLVVEDDAATRTVVTELLSGLGNYVDQGVNGLDALRLLGEFVYDGAFIDLDLPGVDGLKLMRMVRKREAEGAPRLYAIAITARAAPDTESQCREAGFDDFLRKPLTGAMLAAALQRARK
jgi:signal transduction histidine kinase/ligand-binding sensor domain-containing protein/CheY-like chemotaxis protein